MRRSRLGAPIVAVADSARVDKKRWRALHAERGEGDAGEGSGQRHHTEMVVFASAGPWCSESVARSETVTLGKSSGTRLAATGGWLRSPTARHTGRSSALPALFGNGFKRTADFDHIDFHCGVFLRTDRKSVV